MYPINVLKRYAVDIPNEAERKKFQTAVDVMPQQTIQGVAMVTAGDVRRILDENQLSVHFSQLGEQWLGYVDNFGEDIQGIRNN